MKLFGILMMGLLVFAFTGLQDVRANEADEAYTTGLTYYNGEGAKRDYKEALKWFQKAADQGSARAQNNIGGMYYSGEGVTQDYSEALKWFRKAADQGNADAEYNVGLMYLKGDGPDIHFAHKRPYSASTYLVASSFQNVTYASASKRWTNIVNLSY